MREALPAALDAGMTPFEFWTSTILEIRQHLDSYQRRQKTRMQEQAIMDYQHAGMVVNLLAGKNRRIQEVYPWLFEQEEKQDWRIAKERLLHYADAHNRKRAVIKHDSG